MIAEKSLHLNSCFLGRNSKIPIRKFYASNVVTGMRFPFGHYAFYFQFGVVSSRIITDSHWTADLKDPRILRNSGWSVVETAWSTQGDICYLDYDWKWGGSPYEGVSARYLNHPFKTSHEVAFFYDGQTLPRGTILWKPTNKGQLRLIPTRFIE